MRQAIFALLTSLPMLLATRHCPSILLLAALAACQQRPAETAAPPVAPAPGPTASAARTVAQQFSPIISGSWMSAAYLNEVARTRSPMAAFDFVMGVEQKGQFIPLKFSRKKPKKTAQNA